MNFLIDYAIYDTTDWNDNPIILQEVVNLHYKDIELMNLTKCVYIFGVIINNKLYFINSYKYGSIVLCDVFGVIRDELKIQTGKFWYDVILPDMNVMCLFFETAEYGYEKKYFSIDKDIHTKKGDISAKMYRYKLHKNKLYTTDYSGIDTHTVHEEMSKYFLIYQTHKIVDKNDYEIQSISNEYKSCNNITQSHIYHLSTSSSNNLIRTYFLKHDFYPEIIDRLKTNISFHSSLESNVVDILLNQDTSKISHDKKLSIHFTDNTGTNFSYIIIKKWEIKKNNTCIMNVDKNIYIMLIKLLMYTNDELLTNMFKNMNIKLINDVYNLAITIDINKILPYLETLIEFVNQRDSQSKGFDLKINILDAYENKYNVNCEGIFHNCKYLKYLLNKKYGLDIDRIYFSLNNVILKDDIFLSDSGIDDNSLIKLHVKS